VLLTPAAKYEIVPAGQGLMTRTVLAIDLRDDPAAIQTYRRHHQEVWPEVLASLRRAGIRQMDIYLLDRRLVMILETDEADFRRCFAAHAASSPRVVEWEALMRSLQTPAPGAPPGDWWTPMEPVFSLYRAEDTQSVQPARHH
jgi:L-rhamnose mutarotase